MFGLISKVRRELQTLGTLGRINRRMRNVKHDGTDTVADAFERVVATRRSHPAVVFEGRTLTYGELESMANRVAHWAKGEGLARGRCGGRGRRRRQWAVKLTPARPPI